ncbi:phosphotransferase [Oceanobacillus sojae]|uniref:phosphotransferase n=1 Tax=Oceanobacillus sojae TaxID=582851 RepID=UPI00098893AA|nr:phosphotransferase [Oceanobacillus sojae]MCT1902907.1 phosphotransferase [Oceanobacillus sojae]
MNISNKLSEIPGIHTYINKLEIKALESKLKSKQRAFLLTEKYFIKVGTAKEKAFYISLLNEIEMYKFLSSDILQIPKLVDYFQNERYIVLILEKITGSTLAANRNDFTMQKDIDSKNVLKEIKNISKLKEYPENVSVLNRDSKAEGYFKMIYKELDAETRRSTEHLIGTLNQSAKLVFSHGDLIPTNIIKNRNQYYIIDWEWAGLRPDTYDTALFLLFSGCPVQRLSQFDKLDSCWGLMELYRDALLIASREIKNWLDVKDSLMQKKYVKLWLDTLKEAEKRLLLHQ